MEEKSEAERFLKREVEIVDNLDSRLVLLRFYLDNSMNHKALILGEKILESHPDNEDVKQVVANLNCNFNKGHLLWARVQRWGLLLQAKKQNNFLKSLVIRA